MVLAHCPLCTAGAGAAAAAAAIVGVKYGAIGVFIGAFSIALGLWLTKRIKRRYFSYQEQIVAWAIYLSTVLPLWPLLKGDYTSIYIFLIGPYGGWLNRTYLIDLFWVGVAAGTIIVLVSPYLSGKITNARGRAMPYQGLIVTFGLLLAAGLILQFWSR